MTEQRPPEPEGWLPPQSPPDWPPLGATPGPYSPGSYPPGPAGPSGRPPSRPQRTGLILLVALLGASLVLAAAVGLPTYVALSDANDARAAEEADLSAVEVYDDLRTDHVDGRVDYDLAPPPGGPHHRFWLECGAYDEPVPTEFLVHSLEHGTVFIAHDPDLPAADVAQLRETLPDNGILAPYPGMTAEVVVTVWGRQLALDGADDPRLALFIAIFGDGHTAPEPRASCRGGVTPEDAARLLGSATV